MQEALAAWESGLHLQPDPLPLLVRLAVAHYQFEAIHPFLDGNGRVGRLLIVLLMCAWGLLSEPLLYLSVYFERRRSEYYERLLAVTQQGAWEEWLSFFLNGVAAQARDAQARVRRLQDLRAEYRQQLQTERTATRLLQVIDLLFARPTVTVGMVARHLGSPFAAAQRYVNRLEKAGLLREVTGQARNRLYVAQGVLAAVESPLPPDKPNLAR
jgi:Fic family protein